MQLDAAVDATGADTSVIFVPAKAPNPDVGKKFVDFVLGQEAQALMAEAHYVSSLRAKMPSPKLDTGARPLSEIKTIASSPKDLVKFLDQQAELAQRYAELFK